MRTKRTGTFGFAILFGLLAVASSSVAAERLSDETIQARVERELSSENITNGGGPAVVVDNGHVTLTGSVRSLWDKQKAIELAMDIDDVASVEDELTIAFAESDKKLGEEVAKAVRRYTRFTVFDDVNLAVNEGHVVLEGAVTMPYKSEEIERRVAKVMGVQSLTNNIRTLPTSINDSRIRSAVAYRIYRDSLFRPYAFRANPPIHVIVERGRVVLTGAVRSNVEKRKAGHIARSTFGVFSVENRLSVDS